MCELSSAPSKLNAIRRKSAISIKTSHYYLFGLDEKNEDCGENRKSVALSGQKHARRRTGRSVCRIFRHLWGPAVCLLQFGGTEGISLSDRARAGADAAASTCVPERSVYGKAAKSRGD